MYSKNMVKVLLIFTLTSGFSNLRASDEIKQNADRYQCESSNLSQKGAFTFKQRPIREIELPNNKELNIINRRHKINARNINSATHTILTNNYLFSNDHLHNTYKLLNYERNALERYASLRILARKKIEKTIYGIDEAIQYLRWNPQNHPQAHSDSISKLHKMFKSSNSKDNGKPFKAFDLIPTSCTSVDQYIYNMVHSLKDQRKKEFEQTNYNPATDSKYYENYPETEKIYNLEKNNSVLSFQKYLRQAFSEIRTLENFIRDIKRKTKSEYESFEYFLYSHNRLNLIEQVPSGLQRLNFIKNEDEFEKYRQYLLILYSSPEERETLIKYSKKDLLAQSLQSFPFDNIKKSDFKKNSKFFEEKILEAQSLIQQIKNATPIMFVKVKKSYLFDTTIFNWLSDHPEELEPANASKLSAELDDLTQSALVSNLIHNQIPALERTCDLVAKDPKKLICPTSYSEENELLNNQEVVTQVLSEVPHLAQATLNMQLDNHVRDSKRLRNYLFAEAAIAVPSFGLSLASATATGAIKLVSYFKAAQTIAQITKLKNNINKFASLTYVKEAQKALQLAYISSHFGLSLKTTYHQYQLAKIINEQAHLSVKGKSWSSLVEKKTSWQAFYFMAGASLIQGALSLKEVNHYITTSILSKRTQAQITTNFPKFSEQISRSSARLKETYLAQALYKVRNTKNIIDMAIRRTISDGTDAIDAAVKPGMLRAFVDLDKKSPTFRSIRNLSTGPKFEGINPGSMIIKDGVFQAEKWTAEFSNNFIIFVSKSGDSQRVIVNSSLFSVIKNSDDFLIKVKNGAVWHGINQGQKLLAALPKGTNKLSLAIVARGVQIPWHGIKWIAGYVSGGLKLTIGQVVVTSMGIGMALAAGINLGLLKFAEEVKYYTPVSMTGSRETLNSFINRIEPSTINQAQRIAQERDFKLQHHVRITLEMFQQATNDLENKLFYLHWSYKYIIDILKELETPNITDQRKQYLRTILPDYVNRINYHSRRFNQAIYAHQRKLDYEAQWYMLYNENRLLFDKWWNYYFQNRDKYNLASQFTKEATDSSVVFRYGPWIAAYPNVNESTKELDALQAEAEKYIVFANEFTIKVQEMGLKVKPIPSEFTQLDTIVEETTNLKSFNSKDLYFHAMTSEKELLDKKELILKYAQDIDSIFQTLTSTKLSFEEIDHQKKNLLAILERVYTLDIRDLYQWRWLQKNTFEVKLHLLKDFPASKREAIYEELRILSEGKLTFKETLVDDRLQISMNYGHWYASTLDYEDSIKMKKFDVDFSQILEEIEKKIHKLKFEHEIDLHFDGELTTF